MEDVLPVQLLHFVNLELHAHVRSVRVSPQRRHTAVDATLVQVILRVCQLHFTHHAKELTWQESCFLTSLDLQEAHRTDYLGICNTFSLGARVLERWRHLIIRAYDRASRSENRLGKLPSPQLVNFTDR